MTTLVQDAFEAIGAEAFVETAGNAFEIDIRQNGDREVYQLGIRPGYHLCRGARRGAEAASPGLGCRRSRDCQLADATSCAATTSNTGSWLRCHSIDRRQLFAARWRR